MTVLSGAIVRDRLNLAKYVQELHALLSVLFRQLALAHPLVFELLRFSFMHIFRACSWKCLSTNGFQSTTAIASESIFKKKAPNEIKCALLYVVRAAIVCFGVCTSFIDTSASGL